MHHCLVRPALTLGLIFLGLAGCPARAQTSSRDTWEVARRHFDRGAALYSARRYQEAEGEFLRAYDLSHLPDLLFNLSRTVEQLGRYKDALEYLKRYLRERPDAPDRAQIEQDIERLRRLMLPGPPPVVQVPPPARPWWQWPPWPALALAGGGAALLVVGIGLGGAALAAHRQVQSAPEGTLFDLELHRRGQALGSAAIAFDVIGAAALGAGAVWTGLWLYQRRPASQALLVPTGPVLFLTGRF